MLAGGMLMVGGTWLVVILTVVAYTVHMPDTQYNASLDQRLKVLLITA